MRANKGGVALGEACEMREGVEAEENGVEEHILRKPRLPCCARRDARRQLCQALCAARAHGGRWLYSCDSVTGHGERSDNAPRAAADLEHCGTPAWWHSEQGEIAFDVLAEAVMLHIIPGGDGRVGV